MTFRDCQAQGRTEVWRFALDRRWEYQERSTHAKWRKERGCDELPTRYVTCDGLLSFECILQCGTEKWGDTSSAIKHQLYVSYGIAPALNGSCTHVFFTIGKCMRLTYPRKQRFLPLVYLRSVEAGIRLDELHHNP